MVQAMVAVLPDPVMPEQRLVTVAALQPLDQPGDGLGLVAGGPEGRDDLEGWHALDGTGRV